MGFGALRVINDDVIAPDTGFGMHPHRDMEIVTIVLEGEVTHEDSMGNLKMIRAGEIQVMSAGTGVFHSEFNRNPTVPLKLFQIWILPRTAGLVPRYAQKRYSVSPGGFETLVVGTPPGTLPDDDSATGPIGIAQDAGISMGKFEKGVEFSLDISEGFGIYFLAIDGEFQVGDTVLQARDAVGIAGIPAVSGKCLSPGSVLAIRVPMTR
jgi:redox-sensitive bicupin YhaK (pirin superfamily)